jgi:hypothetical protein
LSPTSTITIPTEQKDILAEADRIAKTSPRDVDMARLEDAGRNYAVTGLRTLELAKNAYPRFNSPDPWDQVSLLKMVLSNCTFDRGSLCPAYNKPFELFAQGNESGDWLLRLDSNQQPSG